MSKHDYPITTAVRVLREKKITFTPHVYPFVEHGGTHHAAEFLQVPEHEVIKTIVMQDEHRRPFLVLMHGDCEVSTRQLARELGLKHVDPSDERDAQRHTGYLVGGISPFGTKAKLPIYAEASIFDLEQIYINGGKRGFLVEIDPAEIEKAFPITKVNVAINGK